MREREVKDVNPLEGLSDFYLELEREIRSTKWVESQLRLLDRSSPNIRVESIRSLLETHLDIPISDETFGKSSQMTHKDKYRLEGQIHSLQAKEMELKALVADLEAEKSQNFRPPTSNFKYVSILSIVLNILLLLPLIKELLDGAS
jgi:hypothetical protein